jgi:hypothetical protein
MDQWDQKFPPLNLWNYSLAWSWWAEWLKQEAEDQDQTEEE